MAQTGMTTSKSSDKSKKSASSTKPSSAAKSATSKNKSASAAPSSSSSSSSSPSSSSKNSSSKNSSSKSSSSKSSSSSSSSSNRLSKLNENLQDVGSRITENLHDVSKGQVIATAAGVAAAAAGVAAVKKLRNRKPEGQTVYRVKPNGDEGWLIETDGSVDKKAMFDTKKDAVAAARKRAHKSTPSKLVVHRQDGTEQETFSYED